MTRKHIVSLLMSLLILTGVQAADAPRDIVVLLDTSASMFAHFETLGTAVIQPLLSSRVSDGDTVHIVSFAEEPRLELSRKVESPADIETIATHLLLLYPLEPWSDVIKALDWTAQYLKQLPTYRAKTLVIISDGEHVAGPESQNAALTPAEAKARIEQSALELKGNGWDFLYLKTPWQQTADSMANSDSTIANQNATGDGSGDPSPIDGGESVARGGADLPGEETDTREREDRTSDRQTQGASHETPTSGPADASSRSDSAAKLPDEDTDDGSQEESPGPDGGFDTSDTVADVLPAELHDIDETTGGQDSVALPLNELIIAWPNDLGRVRYRFAIPILVNNTGSDVLMFECRELLANGKNILEKPLLASIKPGTQKKLAFKVALDDSVYPGVQSLSVRARFAGETKIHPSVSDIQLELIGKASKGSSRFWSSLLLVAGIILALALAILILVSFRRSLSSPAKAVYRSTNSARHSDSPDRGKSAADGVQDRNSRTPVATERNARSSAMNDGESSKANNTANQTGTNTQGAATSSTAMAAAGASSPLMRNMPVSEDFPVRKHEERIMLSLFVNDQNTAIGRRNVHLLKAGGKLSLGGGNSDFLVFIVRFPERIAKVHFDGEQCHLTIHKPEFFPNAESSVIEDCIGKRIDIVSAKGYKVWFRIDRYEDPLEKLNRFLRSIEHQQTGIPQR